jgi:class 3 adenylate cyclase
MTEDRQQRRLATILAADVFGYSRLTAENEEDALRTLKAHRGVIDRLISRHEGRIFNTAGDSVLAEFGSAVEAVRCAITIQEELRVRNAQIVESRRMDFRIGINVGDVLVDGDNLYGDGVNIAARLESIAAPGAICISGSVFALVKNKLSYGFEDIGLQTMKNIPEPVSAFRLTPGSNAPRAVVTTRSVGHWALPIAAVVVAVAIVGVGIFYWAGRGKERTAAPVVPAPVASAPAGPSAASPSAQPALPTAAPVPAPPVPAFTNEFLKTEPGIGQIPTGAKILVDDGTCPGGQLKQIIGGNVTTGLPRLRSCVPRPNTPPVAAPPESGPPQLDAAALERMRPYVGNAVEGISIVTGKPFVMKLEAGGTAEVKVELVTAGRFTVDRGSWWIAPNGNFCIHYTRFAGGNRVCRELVHEGGVVKAYTWDHQPNPWVFKK